MRTYLIVCNVVVKLLRDKNNSKAINLILKYSLLQQINNKLLIA